MSTSSPGAGIRILFARPCIPPNTGNAIRTAAVTGCELHLAGPLGFELTDKKVQRAGLDYHDMANVYLHRNLDEALTSLTSSTAPSPHRVFAFSTRGTTPFGEIEFQRGDVVLFGPEPTGLTDAELDDPRITHVVRLPMLPGRRSLNLSNTAAVVVYEAWRQQGFSGGRPVAPSF